MKRITACLVTLVSLSLAAAGAAVESSWSDLNRQVIEMYQKKYYSKAIPVAQKALDLAESTYGSDSPETVLALNNLAMLYKKTKRYKAAEPLYKRALTISERLAGPNHPDLAVPLNNLAMYYQARKNYAKAYEFSLRAISILEKAYGPKHPYVIQAHERFEAMKRGRS